MKKCYQTSYGYSISVDISVDAAIIQQAREREAERHVDIVIRIGDEVKEFTHDEFVSLLGFETGETGQE